MTNIKSSHVECQTEAFAYHFMGSVEEILGISSFCFVWRWGSPTLQE